MSDERSASTPDTPGSRRGLWIMVGVGVALLGLGVWLVVAKLPRLLTTSTGDTPPAAAATAKPAPGAPGAPGEARKIHATLFYVAQTGDELVPVSHEVPYGSTPGEQAREIVQAQLQAAPDGLLSAIPTGTILRTIYLTPSGQAYVDFSPEIAHESSRRIARRDPRRLRDRRRAHRESGGHHVGADSRRRQGSGHAGGPRRLAHSAHTFTQLGSERTVTAHDATRRPPGRRHSSDQDHARLSRARGRIGAHRGRPHARDLHGLGRRPRAAVPARHRARAG